MLLDWLARSPSATFSCAYVFEASSERSESKKSLLFFVWQNVFVFLRLRASEAKRKSLYCSFWGFERAKRSEKVSIVLCLAKCVCVFEASSERSEAKKSLLFFVWQNVFVFFWGFERAKRSEKVSIVLCLAKCVCVFFFFFLFSRFRDICLGKFLWKPISPSLGWLPQNFFRRIFRKTLGYILAEKIFRKFFPLRSY